MTSKKVYYAVSYELYNDNSSKLSIIEKEDIRQPRDQRIDDDSMITILRWYETKRQAEMAVHAILPKFIKAVQTTE